jgi:cytochrome d ubiquinol oxidase subunit II
MAGGLLVLHADARRFYDGVTEGWGLFFAVATALSILVTVLLLHLGVLRGTRLSAIAAVASLVLTWGFAQSPYLLPTTLTIQDGAGDPNSLRWLMIVTAVAVALVGPALVLLYRLDLTDRLAADHDEDLTVDTAPR